MLVDIAAHPWCMGLSFALALAVGCGEDPPTSDDDDTSSVGAGATGGGSATGGAGATGGMLPFALTSSSFVEGATIPTVHECGSALGGPGMDVTPPLSWTPGPAATQSYAVVMRDVDAGNLVHWVIYDIPRDVTSLPQGIARGYAVTDPVGAKQGQIQGAFHGYFGPCSPNSVNTYQLTVHALGDALLPGATMTTTENDIAFQVESSALASASLAGES